MAMDPNASEEPQEVMAQPLTTTQLAGVALSVRGGASGDNILSLSEQSATATIADIIDKVTTTVGADSEDLLFCDWVLLKDDGTEPLPRDKLLADIDLTEDIAGKSLELLALRKTGKRASLTLTEVRAMQRSHPEGIDVELSIDDEHIDLHVLVDRLPNLQRLQINFGKWLYGVAEDYWAPLKELVALEALHFRNHHSHRGQGEMRTDTILNALLSWGDDGPKLKSFNIDGAMRLSLNCYNTFVTENQVLSPELEEFTLQYWFANPPLVNTQIVQDITKRYQKLRKLEVGSCCHSVTDSAFKYFMDNGEGIQAGLELERLFLVCTTHVSGTGWLELDSVKRNLPKLKDFAVGGGRCFCTCGDPRCGDAAHRIAKLQEQHDGFVFDHSATHW